MPKSAATSPPSTRRRARAEINPTSAGTLPLPHEHDQTPEVRHDAKTRPQPEVAQAARDLRAGMVDTDNYTRTRDVARRGAKR